MLKKIEDITSVPGYKRVTTVDERWYIREATDQLTELPKYEFVPSVTWIADSWPKGIGFYKWLSERGWDEAEALKEAAGEKGGRVHKAIETFLETKEIKIDAKFDNDEGELQELTLEEWQCLMAFADWYNEVKPEVLKGEFLVWNDEHNYAGTVDLLCRINGEIWLIDFKTSQNVYPTHEIQVSAYKHAYSDKIDKLGILQVGHRRNKCGWKFTEVEDQFDLFLAAKQIWKKEHSGEKPSQKDYPVVLKLNDAPLVKTKKQKTNEKF